jgi:hypothetical protein
MALLYYFTLSNADDFTSQRESSATQWVNQILNQLKIDESSLDITMPSKNLHQL